MKRDRDEDGRLDLHLLFDRCWFEITIFFFFLLEFLILFEEFDPGSG